MGELVQNRLYASTSDIILVKLFFVNGRRNARGFLIHISLTLIHEALIAFGYASQLSSLFRGKPNCFTLENFSNHLQCIGKLC